METQLRRSKRNAKPTSKAAAAAARSSKSTPRTKPKAKAAAAVKVPASSKRKKKPQDEEEDDSSKSSIGEKLAAIRSKKKKQTTKGDSSSDSSVEDVVTSAAAVMADRNTKRPKGADSGDVDADKKKKKPKASKKFDWRNSAAKKYLKLCFKDGTIPLTYPSDEGGSGPRAVWDQHCKDHPSFKGMEYDNNFTSRLRTVKNDAMKKMKRAAVDKANLEAFRAQHPIDATNARGLGELRWEGSDAEKFLKEDIESILQMDDEVEMRKKIVPLVLHASRPEYALFPLKKFRDHIYQERRLRKFLSYSEAEKNKPSKNKVME
jgi:hypothetical protein